MIRTVTVLFLLKPGPLDNLILMVPGRIERLIKFKLTSGCNGKQFFFKRLQKICVLRLPIEPIGKKGPREVHAYVTLPNAHVTCERAVDEVNNLLHFDLLIWM